MARLPSTSQTFLHRRSDTGQYVYMRDVKPSVAILVVGEIERPWTGKTFQLTGRSSIKISLKTTDPRIANDRWLAVHPQIEELVLSAEEGLRKAAHDRKPPARRKIKVVPFLTQADRAAIAEQVRHDILADDDQSWAKADHLNPMAKAVMLAAQGRMAQQEAANRGREIAAGASRQALRAKDAGLLNAALREVVDSDRAKVLLDRIAAAGVNADVNDLKELQSLHTVKVRDSELTERLAENGLALPEESEEHRLLALNMLRASVQAHTEIGDRLTGKNVPTPVRPPPIVPEPLEEDSDAPRLSTGFETWVRLKRPRTKTKEHGKAYLDRFIGIYGDLPLNAVTRDQIRKFRDLMLRFPRNVPEEIAQLSAPEIAAWADARPNLRKLSRTTVNNRAVGGLSTIFETALKEGHVQANPCRDLRLDVKPSDRKKVVSFTVDELNKLFAAPELLGKPSFSAAGGGKAARWIPLIGLYAGARLEEIAQLRVSDVVKIEDFHALRITAEADESVLTGKVAVPGDERSLKTEASQRIVPIHDVLIDAGLLAYAEARRDAGDVWLFPLVDAAGDRRSKNFSRWIGRIIDKYVSRSPQKNFHSFRHTFVEGLRNGEVGRDVIKALVGHADEDVTDRYGGGCSPRTMRNGLKLLDYPGFRIPQ